MLKAEQGCKKIAAEEQGGPLPRQDEGQHEDAKHEAIVLKVNVVNDEQARREDD